MSPEREHTSSRRIVHPDLAALLLILFVTGTAPAFLEDDAAFFNYLANVSGARPFFYYYGYVSFIATPVAFALSGLPFVLQAVLYRVVPLVAVLLLYRELTRFFALGTKTTDARWLAVATLLIARGVDIYVWANLTYAIWPAFLAATLYVIRTNVEQRRYSTTGVIGIGLAAMSNPLGLLLVPLLAVFARFSRPARTPNLVLATTLTLAHLALYAQSPATVIGTANPLRLAWLFIGGYRTEFKLNTLAVALSLTVIAIAVMVDLRRRSTAVDRAVLWSLSFLGVASVAVYMFSDRFTLLEGGFRSQHVLPVLFAALIIAGRAIVAIDDQRRRALLFGVFLGFSAATMTRELYFHLRGPLELSLLKYRFLMAADQFRDSCREPDALLFEDSSSSPIVLCRPRDFAIGRHPILNVPPVVGIADHEGEDIIERPAIIVGKPLF